MSHYIEYFEMSNDVPKKKTLKMFKDLANREGDYKDQIEGIKWITDMTLNDSAQQLNILITTLSIQKLWLSSLRTVGASHGSLE